MEHRPPSLLRSVTAVALLGAATLALTRLGAATLGAGRPTLEDLVGGGVLLLAALAGAALTVGAVLLVVVAGARAAGRAVDGLERAAVHLTPAVLRRAVAVTVGAGLGLGAVAPAGAAEIDLGWDAPAATTTVSENQAGRPGTAPVLVSSPEPAPPGAPEPTPAPGTSAARPATHVVRPGESLWTIAADHLPDPTSDAEIAAAWPAWYAANRDVIGADPDLVVPGQVLTAPDEAATR